MAYLPVRFRGDDKFSVQCRSLPDVGDEIKFSRPRYTGVYPNRKFLDWEVLTGRVVASSYGKKTNRHTFTILSEGKKRTVQARTLYEHGFWRKSVFA